MESSGITLKAPTHACFYKPGVWCQEVVGCLGCGLWPENQQEMKRIMAEIKEISPRSLPRTIMELRESLELSQETLALRLGTTRFSVIAWEQGKAFPRGFTLLKLLFLALEAEIKNGKQK